MAARKPAEAVPNLDDLLSTTETPKAPEKPVGDSIDLSANEDVTVTASELTEDQIRIKDLEDRLAKAEGRRIEDIEDIVEEGSEVVVHVLSDGFTAQGRVWYTGQEIVFGPQAYEQTKDARGLSWIQLSDEAQYARWGEVKFRKGPWPGKKEYDEEGLEGTSNRAQAPVVNL